MRAPSSLNSRVIGPSKKKSMCSSHRVGGLRAGHSEDKSGRKGSPSSHLSTRQPLVFFKLSESTPDLRERPSELPNHLCPCIPPLFDLGRDRSNDRLLA